MSQTPKDTNIQFTAEQVAEINACERPDQIQPLIEKFMLQNGNARINEDGVSELVIGPAAHAHEWIQTIEIGGENVTVRGASELELAKNVTEAYRTQGQTPTQKRGADGKFVAEPSAVKIPEDEQELATEVAELRLKVIRGELLPEEMIAQKTAFEDGLRESREWRQSVEAFRNSPAGSDWPGGDRNRDLLVSLLGELDMTTGLSAEEKLASLVGIWTQMRKSGNYFEAEVSPAELAAKLADQAIQEQANSEMEKELETATSASQVQEILTRYGHRPERDASSSGLFGR